jgi:hypothetical protein
MMDYQDTLSDASDTHYVVAESSNGKELVHPHLDVKIGDEKHEYDLQSYHSILQIEEKSKNIEKMVDMIKDQPHGSYDNVHRETKISTKNNEFEEFVTNNKKVQISVKSNQELDPKVCIYKEPEIKDFGTEWTSITSYQASVSNQSDTQYMEAENITENGNKIEKTVDDLADPELNDRKDQALTNMETHSEPKDAFENKTKEIDMNTNKMRDTTLGSDEKLKADDNDIITNDYMTSKHEEKQPLIKALSAQYTNNLDADLQENPDVDYGYKDNMIDTVNR